MIPKIIHYCWFGDGKMSETLKKCINSWELNMPDYEIKLWNETNTKFDIPFLEQAYKLKKYAFVSDYIRLKVVHENGGIYLDTDMFILKKLDLLLNCESFWGAEHNNSIGVGVFGAQPGNPVLNKCLKYYDDLSEIELQNFSIPPIPAIVTNAFRELYDYDGCFAQNLILDNIIVYKPSIFYPLPYAKRGDIHRYKNYVKKESLAVHLWNGSWNNFYNEFDLIRRKQYLKAASKIFRFSNIQAKCSVKYALKLISALKYSLKKSDL